MSTCDGIFLGAPCPWNNKYISCPLHDDVLTARPIEWDVRDSMGNVYGVIDRRYGLYSIRMAGGFVQNGFTSFDEALTAIKTRHVRLSNE